MGPAWSSQGHICGPSVPRTKPPPHVCTLGPGPASLIPQPCRDQAFFFFNVPCPEHSVSPFDLSQDWAQSPVGGGWRLAPEVLPAVFSLLLLGFPQGLSSGALPSPCRLGLLPRASQLHSQVSGTQLPREETGRAHHGFLFLDHLGYICALFPSVFSTCAVPAAPSQSLETCSEGGEGLGPCLPSGTAPCHPSHVSRLLEGTCRQCLTSGPSFK